MTSSRVAVSGLRGKFPERLFQVKKKFLAAVMALSLVSFTLPALALGQNQAGQEPAVGHNGVGSPGRNQPGATSAATGRRMGRRGSLSEAAAGVEQDFDEALQVVQENYVDGKKLDYNNVFKSSITGMLRSLDPHSNYFDREEYEEMLTEQRSEYYGIGATINNERLGDDVETYIIATFENSPAWRAGLRFGDRIISVNGEQMSGKDSSYVRDKIRGPRGTVAKVTVERASTHKQETVEITRDAVPQPTVPDAYMLRPGVGYISLTQFNYTTADELQAALEYLHGRGMTSLVLDLRNNPGGILEQAIRVSSAFLRNGQLILTQRGRDRSNDVAYQAENSKTDSVPLVILVNGYTASASEIVSGAMQDHDRALIVGETSFGKGLVQGVWPLEYGAGLTLTTAKYYTPSGRLIQRDYTNSGFYDYYTRGGSIRRDTVATAKPAGPESRTDTGRPVYGGGGITPDVPVKPRILSGAEVRLLDPLFYFSRDLTGGRIGGFDAYTIARAVDFNHSLQPTDFPITDALFKTFRDYLASRPEWKALAPFADRDRSFVDTQLRYNLVTAAYGKYTADEVLNMSDPQVAKAIDVVPRARELALAALHSGRSQP